jgi:uncharacterized protein
VEKNNFNQEKTMNFCRECGSKLNPNSKFCNNCGIQLSGDDAVNVKKNIVMGDKKKNITWFNGAIVIIFFGLIAFYFMTIRSKEELVIQDQPTISESVTYPTSPYRSTNITAEIMDGFISIPLSSVKNSKFVSFTYRNTNRSIPLLAYLTEDGKVVTAVRMCESFHIKNDELVCDACGTTWELNNLEAISGSCGKYPPDPIPSKVKDDKIIINAADVEKWQRRV